MVTRLLASRSKSTHDTRHDTRLPVLTEVDGSMSPLEELDDTTRTRRFGVKPVCIENVSITITYIQGLYLYPVVAWLRMDYEHNIWYLILSLSAIAYPSIRPLRSGHVITQSRKISANSPSAERKQTADRELLCRIFPKKPSFSRTDFLTKLGPQTRLLPVPNFGVNTLSSCPNHLCPLV
jgi:hypothetical protein